MPRQRRLVVPPAALCSVWSHRLLRLIAEPARKRASGHTVIRSFEPGEDWFYDYETDEGMEGPALAPPEHHPLEQPTPGPAGKVPRDWQRYLH